MTNVARLILLSFIVGALGRGQDTPTPAPIMTAPTVQMAWQMTLELDKTDAKVSGNPAVSGPLAPGIAYAPLKPPPQPVQWNFTHSGNLTHIFVINDAGASREYWRVAKHVSLYRNVNSLKLKAKTDGPIPAYPCASDGFYGVEKVKPEDSRGLSEYEGIKYQYFRGDYDSPSQPTPFFIHTAPAPSPKAVYEAWFDIKTGLPKAYREGDKTYVFKFGPPPSGQLELPTEWQNALDRYTTDMQRSGLPVGF